MKSNILVIGNCSIDQFMKIGEPHMINEKICFIHGTKIPVQDFKATIAGNACHVGLGTQKLGMNATVYTELGDDENGRKFLSEFEKSGVDTTYCRLDPERSTNVHAIIAYGNERTIFSYHGPIEYHLDFDKLEKPQWIYYTSLGKGYQKFQEKLVEYLDKNPDIAVACNPGTHQLSTGVEALEPILKRTSVLLVNKEEAQKLTKHLEGYDKAKENYEELHKLLHQLGPKLTVITDGNNGSSTYDGDKYIFKEPQKVEREFVDKTGAGDAYSSAFVAALHHKKPIATAMEWGNKNSANTIGYIGGVEGLLSLEEIE